MGWFFESGFLCSGRVLGGGVSVSMFLCMCFFVLVVFVVVIKFFRD